MCVTLVCYWSGSSLQLHWLWVIMRRPLIFHIALHLNLTETSPAPALSLTHTLPHTHRQTLTLISIKVGGAAAISIHPLVSLGFCYRFHFSGCLIHSRSASASTSNTSLNVYWLCSSTVAKLSDCICTGAFLFHDILLLKLKMHNLYLQKDLLSFEYPRTKLLSWWRIAQKEYTLFSLSLSDAYY